MSENVQEVNDEPVTPRRSRKADSRSGRKRMGIGAVVAIAIAAGLVAWLLIDRHNSSFALNPVTPIAPQALTADGLKSTAGQLGQPVYWAGPKAGYTYALERDRNDNIHVTYLPPGTALGAKGNYLVVGTFRFVDALSAIQRASHNHGTRTLSLPNSGLAVYNPAQPWAYWFAVPGSHYQAGVFTPNSPPLARRLVASGQIVPVN